jgi:ferredoxin
MISSDGPMIFSYDIQSARMAFSPPAKSLMYGVDSRIRLLQTGKRIACDALLVGVGAVACDELARDAGLACENGVTVDLSGRTSDPAVYAIGDVTWRPLPLYGGKMFRLESVQNALEQARQAVCSIMGHASPAPEVPWFWSDQYDVKLQIAGIPFEADDSLLRGSPESSKFAVFHLKGDRLLAVETINSPAASVVEGAVRNDVAGTDADCGGACACATCHVYLEDSWVSKTGSRAPAEEPILEVAVNLKPNSRLSCRIKATEELNGLVVHIPESQR